MRAGIYARISEDRDETQLGVSRQITDCAQLSERRGWEVVDRYVDNDVSAYSGRRRPEYERMLDDIRAGRIDAIVVYHQDRLHRQPRELEQFFDVCDRAGVTSMASVSGDVDLATDDGRLKARIMGAVARNQSDAASRRIRRKHLQLAQEGRPIGGGHRPFGYERDAVTIRPGEAEIIRDLAGRLLAGETLRGLAADLNDRGIRTTTGGAWAPQVVKRMLASPRISGQRQHQGEIIGDASWPAIIPAEQTARIRTLLADPSRRATRAPQRYVLKGLLRCWRCEHPLVSRPRDDGQRRYVCAKGPGFSGCGGVYVLSEPIELFVTEAVLTHLDTPRLAEAIRGRPAERGDEWQQRADHLVERLDELAAAYAGEEISMREWLAAREPLQRQLDEARRRATRDASVRVISDHVGHGQELRKRWGPPISPEPGLSIDVQHAILSAAIARVVVGQARRGYNRFDPDRFELLWRH